MAAPKKNAPRTKAPVKASAEPKKAPAPAPVPEEKEKGSGRELFGLFLLCLGVLSAIYSFFPSSNLATDVLQGLAGKLCFLMPLLLLWAGALVAFSSGRKMNPGRISLMLGMVLLLFAFVHLITVHETYRQVSVRRFVNYCLYCYSEQAGSGIIGAALAYPLYLTVGRVGGMVVVIFLAIADLVLLRVISLQKIGSAARTMAQSSAENMRIRRDARREEMARRYEERERMRQETLYVERISPVASSAGHEEHAAEEPAAPVRRRSVPRMESAVEDAQIFETVTARPRKPRSMQEPTEETYTDRAAIQPARRAKKADTDVVDVFRTPEHAPALDHVPNEEEITEIPLKTGIEAEFAASPVPEETLSPIPEETPEEEFEDLPFPADPYMEAAEQELEEDASPFDTEEDGVPDADASEDDNDAFDDSPAFDDANDDLVERRSPYVAASRRQHTPRTMEMPAEKEPAKDSLFEAPDIIDPASRIDGSPLVAPKQEPRAEEEVFGEYNYPPVDLLTAAKPSQIATKSQADQEKAKKLEETLHSFGIAAKLVGIAHGPAVTRFELLPAPGVKVSRITSLADDIALSLAALNIRIEAPIPGKSAVGVEVPNEEVEIVNLREVLESNEARKHPSRLAVALGKDNSGRYIVSDLAKMPHLLIAGATGSGKSVCINNFICSILYRAAPEEVRMIMIDPKMVELSVYNGIPHLLIPVVTDPKKAAGALAWAVAEMTQRYKLFSEKGVRDMKGYNLACGPEDKPMPQIVVIIDELADLMMVCPGEVEDSICRLAQLARAAGIHLVIATQRPSVNVITGIIKANIPSRIAFTVASQVDSRTILDVGGAEKLLGRGDMLYAPSGTTKPARVQGAWVSDKEVASIVEYIKARHDAEYDEDLIEHINNHDAEDEPETEAETGEVDELLAQAIEMSVESGQASISMLQRRLRVGYARAGRLIDEMAARGIVSQSEGAKPRTVLITREQYKMMFGDD